jgi:predicted membrane metal-binding protein
MISAYGAIWYDLGSIGLYITSFFHAVLLILTIKGLTSKGIIINTFSQISFSFFMILHFMAPLTLALNIMVSPFYVFSMMLLIIILVFFNLKRRINK